MHPQGLTRCEDDEGDGAGGKIGKGEAGVSSTDFGANAMLERRLRKAIKANGKWQKKYEVETQVSIAAEQVRVRTYSEHRGGSRGDSASLLPTLFLAAEHP